MNRSRHPTASRSNPPGRNTTTLGSVNPTPTRRGDQRKVSERTQDPKQYGHIPGIPVGKTWPRRSDISSDAVHAQLIAGIAGTGATGAFSVVLSGGYEDDVDNGKKFIYTGSGGRDKTPKTPGKSSLRMGQQIADQDFKGANAALWTSSRTHNPVRVIRGSKLNSKWAPLEGYIYSGLYTIKRVWKEKGKKGFVMCRFAFKRCPGQPPLPYNKDRKIIVRPSSPASSVDSEAGEVIWSSHNSEDETDSSSTSEGRELKSPDHDEEYDSLFDEREDIGPSTSSRGKKAETNVYVEITSPPMMSLSRSLVPLEIAKRKRTWEALKAQKAQKLPESQRVTLSTDAPSSSPTIPSFEDLKIANRKRPSYSTSPPSPLKRRKLESPDHDEQSSSSEEPQEEGFQRNKARKKAHRESSSSSASSAPRLVPSGGQKRKARKVQRSRELQSARSPSVPPTPSRHSMSPPPNYIQPMAISTDIPPAIPAIPSASESASAPALAPDVAAAGIVENDHIADVEMKSEPDFAEGSPTLDWWD